MQDKYSPILQERLDRMNLRVYGAAMLLAAETDEPAKTCDQRIRQYLKKDSKTLRQFTELIEVLGGNLAITWEGEEQVRRASK